MRSRASKVRSRGDRKAGANRRLGECSVCDNRDFVLRLTSQRHRLSSIGYGRIRLEEDDSNQTIFPPSPTPQHP